MLKYHWESTSCRTLHGALVYGLAHTLSHHHLDFHPKLRPSRVIPEKDRKREQDLLQLMVVGSAVHRHDQFQHQPELSMKDVNAFIDD